MILPQSTQISNTAVIITFRVLGSSQINTIYEYAHAHWLDWILEDQAEPVSPAQSLYCWCW
jgi:hypothetical protein